MLFRFNEPLAEKTTMGVGGVAAVYVEADSVDDLREAIAYAREKNLPIRLLGGGSNVIVASTRVEALVLKLGKKFQFLTDEEGGRLRVGAATPLSRVVRQTMEKGFGGLVELTGIPGTIGGALAMNAGTPKAEIGDFVESVHAIHLETGEERILSKKEMAFAYRQTGLVGFCFLSCILCLPVESVPNLVRRRATILGQRRKKFPVRAKSAGCVFKNPEHGAAGALIDQSGLKGYRIGGAIVSPLHANFIINEGNARSEDVLALINIIRKTVSEKTGNQLQLEVKIW